MPEASVTSSVRSSTLICCASVSTLQPHTGGFEVGVGAVGQIVPVG